jgi:hypothetical protein
VKALADALSQLPRRPGAEHPGEGYEHAIDYLARQRGWGPRAIDALLDCVSEFEFRPDYNEVLALGRAVSQADYRLDRILHGRKVINGKERARLKREEAALVLPTEHYGFRRGPTAGGPARRKKLRVVENPIESPAANHFTHTRSEGHHVTMARRALESGKINDWERDFLESLIENYPHSATPKQMAKLNAIIMEKLK